MNLPVTPALTRRQRIESRLREAFSPSHVEIIDESAKHAGHAHRMNLGDEGETHFQVKIVAAAFAGHARVARHRAVNEALADEFQTGLHALALTLQTPSEAEKAA